MEDEDAVAAELYDLRERKPASPGFTVVVAPDGNDGSDGGELIEHLGPADVPRVDEEVAIAKGAESFGSEQVVGVGDHADFRWGHRRILPRRACDNRIVTFPGVHPCLIGVARPQR